MKVILSKIGVLALILSLVLPTGAASASFRDVPENHWAYPYVQSMADQGIVSGVGEGLFLPDRSVSMAEFSVMIVNAFYGGYYGSSTGGAWWDGYLAKLDACGILQGLDLQKTNGQWDDQAVTDPMPRYDMALMMYQTLKAQGIMVENWAQVAQAQDRISDLYSIPSRYQEAVVAMYAMGCLSGADETGAFLGYQSVTRAQACAALYRLQETIDEYNLLAQNAVSYENDWENRALRLINQVRQENGRAPLEYREELVSVARAHSEDMRDRSFYSHVNPDGQTAEDRLDKAGIAFSRCGENIAAGYPSPESVINGWMASPEYRDVILGEYDAAGVGFAAGSGDGYYWTLCVISY